MPSRSSLARRFGVLLGLVAVVVGAPVSAAPNTTTVPTYVRNEPAIAAVAASTAYLEVTYTGFLRNRLNRRTLTPEAVTFTRRCSGVVVNPAGYVVSTSVCVQPPDEVVLINALYRWGRSMVRAGSLPPEELDDFVTRQKTTAQYTGKLPASRPAVAVTGQLTGDLSGTTTPIAAVPGVVTRALPAVGDNVALVRLRLQNLPTVELGRPPDYSPGTPLVIAGYRRSEGATDAGPYLLQARSVEVTGQTGTSGIGVNGEIGPDSRGGPVVDATGRLVALLATDTAVPSGPVHDLIGVSNISRLLDVARVPNELREADRAYRTALDHYFAGRYTTAVVAFDRVLVLDPGYQAARAYRDRAEVRRHTDGDVSENQGTWLLYLLSAAAGALVIVTGRATGARLRHVVANRRENGRGAAVPPPPDGPVAAPLGKPATGAAATDGSVVIPAATDDTVVLPRVGSGERPSDDTVVFPRIGSSAGRSGRSVRADADTVVFPRIDLAAVRTGPPVSGDADTVGLPRVGTSLDPSGRPDPGDADTEVFFPRLGLPIRPGPVPPPSVEGTVKGPGPDGASRLRGSG